MVDRRIVRVIRGFLVVEHEGDGQTKVGAKRVDEHGAAHVCCPEDKDIDGLIGWEEHQLKEGYDDQLEGAGLAQNCSHCD